VGDDIVFAAGRYAPGTAAGDRLLAHELTHVVQQSGAASQRVDQFAISSVPTQISRYAEAEEEVETEEEVDLELENYERYGIPPHSLRGLSEMIERQNERRQTVASYEKPTATLQPGGQPPDFVTVEGEGQVMTANGTYTFRRRSFHVLEAIRYGVSRATTEKDLEAVATTFLGYVGRPGKLPELNFSPTFLIELPSYPEGFDPGAEQRLDTYQETLEERVKAVPSLSKSRLAALGKKRKTKKGCIERAVSPGGENLNPMANLFAAHACRLSAYADFEWRVTTPTGMGITYDGKIGDTVYECKCGYEGIIDDLVSGVAWREARANNRLSNEFDEQMRRQQRIASECGFGYRYMVSSSRLAALLRHRWPDVFLDEYPWYETCN
jgi:hypothetical protein